MMRAFTFGLMLLSPLFLTGCPAPMPAPIPDEDTTPLDPGIYNGQVTRRVDVFAGAARVNQTSSTVTITETVGQEGIPLLVNGEPLQSGKSIILAQAGDNQLTGDITTVEQADNRVVINMDIVGQVDGLDVTGFAQTTYTQVGANAIRFQFSAEFSGIDEANQVIRQVEEQDGTLSR